MIRRRGRTSLVSIFSLVSLFCIWAAPVLTEAALCAFRNPDRDLYVLFPKATGYRTVIKLVDSEIKARVEKYLGQPLDYDEGGEHTFYFVLKGEEVIGVIRPHAERGRYGIVEIVWAYSLDGEIKGFLLQRSREKNTKSVKQEAFRRQFIGKSLKDSLTISSTKKINKKIIIPPEGAERVASIIAYSAKKNLFLFKIFFQEAGKYF